MKRIVSLLLCLMVLALSVVSVSAATRKDVLDYANATIPAKYATYHIWAENIIGQYDLTEQEWDQVLTLAKELKTYFETDEGQSLHMYSAQNQVKAREYLGKFCSITGSSYEIRPASNPKHKGDQIVLLYKADGTLVATLDGDLYPDKTDLDSGANWLVLGAGLLLLAGVSAFVVRRARFQA